MTIDIPVISDRVAELKARISEAALRAGRDPTEIVMVAVTKTHPVEVIEAAFDAGLRHFGENRAEEAQTKIGTAQTLLAEGAVWHMIGHVQSRKSADVANLFRWVHSVDRLKIARRLGEAAVQAGSPLDILFEVNLSGEEGKYGYDLSRWPGSQEQGDQFCTEAGLIAGIAGLRVRGLMTMAPFTDDAEKVRPIFQRLARLREMMRVRLPDWDFEQLSMGMSADYEVAVEEGATIVRIGSALFGPRRPQE